MSSSSSSSHDAEPSSSSTTIKINRLSVPFHSTRLHPPAHVKKNASSLHKPTVLARPFPSATPLLRSQPHHHASSLHTPRIRTIPFRSDPVDLRSTTSTTKCSSYCLRWTLPLNLFRIYLLEIQPPLLHCNHRLLCSHLPMLPHLQRLLLL